MFIKIVVRHYRKYKPHKKLPFFVEELKYAHFLFRIEYKEENCAKIASLSLRINLFLTILDAFKFGEKIGTEKKLNYNIF